MGLACIVCVGNWWPEIAEIACKEKSQSGFKMKVIIVPSASLSGRDLKKSLQVQQIHFSLFFMKKMLSILIIDDGYELIGID